MKSGWTIALSVGLIAAATLVPTGGGGGGSGICILCGSRGAADFLLNVALFAPLGAALAVRGVPLLAAVVAGAVLSGLIEVAQVSVISGRDSNVGDLLANTTGAGAGWLALAWWRRSRTVTPRLAVLLPSMAAGLASVLVLAGLALLTPSYPDTTYYLQWTARFGNMEAYEGEVVTSRIGPLELPGPPGPMAESDSARALLRAGAAVEAVVRAGPPPAGLAPILSIYDGRQREIVLLGADGVDLVYRYRSLAETMRLDRGELRFPGALEGVTAGEVVSIGVARDGARHCGIVDERLTCTPGFTAADTWTLLYYRPEWSAAVRRALGLVWLAALFFPAGLLGRRWRDRGAAALVMAVGLVVAPLLLGFPPTTMAGVLAAAAGIVLGGLARRLEQDSLSA